MVECGSAEPGDRPRVQKHVVTVYKLVAEGTIEEKIIDIQERKKKLAEQVLEGEGMDSASFTKEEILELLG